VYSIKMRAGLLAGMSLVALGGCLSQAFAQDAVGEQGESAALRIQKESLPDHLKTNLLIWVVASCFVVALSGYLARKFDWQQLPQARVCSHCKRVHSTAGGLALLFDIGSASAFLYLVTLPYVAALKGQSFALSTSATAVLLGVVLVLGLIGLGSAVRMVRPIPELSVQVGSRLPNSFLLGIRIAGILTGVAILVNGDALDAVSSNVDLIFGSELGQRLTATVGTSTIRDTSVVLVLSALASCTMRWILPFLGGSRPLAFARSFETLHRPAGLVQR